MQKPKKTRTREEAIKTLKRLKKVNQYIVDEMDSNTIFQKKEKKGRKRTKRNDSAHP